MLTNIAPLLAYILSYPILLICIFKIEIGILYFITLIPIISAMRKIADFPGGNNIPDYLLIAMVMGWIVRASKKNEKIFKSSPVNIVVLLTIVWSFLNYLMGCSEFDGDINLVRLMAWKNYMILPVIYFVAINNIKDEHMLKWIIGCVCLSMLVMDFNFYSTFRWLRSDHYSDSIRISGTFSFLGPNEMGIFYSMYTFLLLGISYFITEKKFRYPVLLICACNFYPIIFSFSRAAYTSTLVGIIVLGFLKDRRILILLVILIVFYQQILPSAVVERINMTFLDKNNIVDTKIESSAVEVGSMTVDTVGRKELWEKAKNNFGQHPFFGIGFDTFRHREGMITHSMYLKILAEQGIVGCIVFLIFSLTVLSQAYKLFKQSRIMLGRGIGLGFFTCVSVHLVGSLTGDQSLYYNLMAINWLFLGIIASLNIHYVNNNEISSKEIQKG